MVAMLRDCIYGQAVGDALGVPYEFMPRDTFKCVGMAGYGTHNQPPGTWSDDTSMALAICDSYRELGCIDIADIREKFLAWYRDGAYSCDGLFDIGNATATALRLGHGLSGERASDGTRRVGIVAKVDGKKHAVAIARCVGKAPQRRFERMAHVTT